jgi:hypothetical protein
MATTQLYHDAAAGNQKTWTFSAWIKKSNLGSNAYLFSQGSSGTNFIGIYFGTNDEFKVYNEVSSSQTLYFITNRLLRDTSAWYHIVVQCDTTQATEADRFKIWINGSQETSFSTAAYPAQNSDTNMNAATRERIGVYHPGGSSPNHYWNGYMSHIALVDGSVVAPTVFGETDSTSGIWKFKQPTGVTWGTNGFHLKFENSGNLGLDSSGNSNTFSLSGNGRQALDTPSNVYATWNPLSRSTGNVYSNGNTTVAYSNNYQKNANATLTFNNGKWYAEFKRGGAANLHIGIVGNTFLEDGRIVTDTSSNHTYNMRGHTGCVTLISNSSDQDIYVDGSDSGTNVDFYSAAGDIVMVAFDSATKKIWFGKNGTWSGSGNPATGANASLTYSGTATSDFTFGTDTENGSSCSANFGSGYFGTTAISSAGSNGNGSLFEYDVPSGYYALNTKNINTYG